MLRIIIGRFLLILFALALLLLLLSVSFFLLCQRWLPIPGLRCIPTTQFQMLDTQPAELKIRLGLCSRQVVVHDRIILCARDEVVAQSLLVRPAQKKTKATRR